MATDNRRVLRMLCKGLLLISLPLAGFVWTLPETGTTMALAAIVTIVALVVCFGAEFLAASTENDIEKLSDQMAAAGESRAEALAQHDEKLRQLDRVVNMLTEQNHDLRAKLLAVQVGLQRQRDALLRAAGEAIASDDRALPAPAVSVFARAN